MRNEVITVDSIRIVKGSTINPKWKADMYVINNKYLMSSISSHNLYQQEMSFEVGQDYSVLINDYNWIANNI